MKLIQILQVYLVYLNITITQGAVDELLVQHSFGQVDRPLLGHGDPDGVCRPELLVVGIVSTASVFSTLGQVDRCHKLCFRNNSSNCFILNTFSSVILFHCLNAFLLLPCASVGDNYRARVPYFPLPFFVVTF